MEFFDNLIDKASELIETLPKTAYNYSENNMWQDSSQPQVILQRDTAFELKGTGFNLTTTQDIADGTIVAGKDLKDIKDSCGFARISLVQIEDIADEQKTYNLIKKTEYVKYHCFPDGYMIRSTSRSHKEAVRVSKKAVAQGISFEKAGNLLIKKYKEIPSVKGVKVIFITSPEAPFKKLEELAEKSTGITETLNHVMNSVNFDCDTCNLKAVCDEVEGMRELHFKRNR